MVKPFELNCSHYEVKSASIGHGRGGSVFRCTLSPVTDDVLEALGVSAEPSWLAAVPPPEKLSWTRARAADARWATQHLAPWIKRRLTGRSSGDLVQPKRPALEPVT